MTNMMVIFLLVLSLAVPVSAAEIVAPGVPTMGREYMPHNTDSFGDALWELLQNSIKLLWPECEKAVEISFGIVVTVLLFSILPILSERINTILPLAGAAAVFTLMFPHADVMIEYAAEAVRQICEYGKLLCPVMTTALAAQGGITTSAALYTGTTVFISCLSMLVSGWIIPMVYLFLVLSVSHCALGNEVLKRFSDAVKSVLTWLLKTLMIVFTTYMSITGAVSGTTDAAALKAAKITISSTVPVVGGILSDASESVLVSMGIVKNTAGIYGILAVLAVFMGPFVQVGVQYLLLKASAGICCIYGNKKMTALIDDFSAAMGLLLAMVAASCLLVLVSTVCFMKGIG